MLRVLPNVSLSAVYVVVRPSTFVRSQIDTYGTGLRNEFTVGARLTAFYLLNLILYAVPLTLATISVISVSTTPPEFATELLAPFTTNVRDTWRFAATTVRNSAYLTVASVLTFITFHAGVVITRNSNGILQTLHTVVYTAGIYLAGIFTIVWYLSTSAQIAVADDLLLTLQKRFIYVFIDRFNASVALPSGRPSTVDTSQLTSHGELVLALLVVTVCYFLYSLYLGARINHDTSRIDALLVLFIVTISPAVYVTGSILAATTTAFTLL